jgi:hypothetical protein
MYWIALVIIGITGAAYVFFRWFVHFVSLGHWWYVCAMVSCLVFLGFALWLRIPLAMFVVAIAIGLGSTLLLGGFNTLLP